MFDINLMLKSAAGRHWPKVSMMTNIEAFQETVICKRIDCRSTPHQVASQGRTLNVGGSLLLHRHYSVRIF
jgi:hypothetical protein